MFEMVTEPCGGKSNLLLLCLYAHKYLGVKGCKVEKDYQHHKSTEQKDVVQGLCCKKTEGKKKKQFTRNQLQFEEPVCLSALIKERLVSS